MEEAKTLIRTTVRTFFNHPKQILIVDAIMLHSVLHMDDLAVLVSAQPKDIRSLMNPLRAARLVSTQSRMELRIGSQRGSPREYYYCPFHPAIDAIKYRIAKLRKKVEALYQQDETKRKDWRCPRCKAEYEELEILDKIGDEGFYCDRCGATLVQNERAAQDRGNHEKIRRLNDQLKKFDDMILKIDRKDVPQNDFESAWERKKEVPRERGGKAENQYVALERADKNQKRGPEMVKVENLAVNLTSGAEADREEAERKEERRRLLAKQNQLPVWHTSIIGAANGGSTGAASGVKLEPDPASVPVDSGVTLIPKKEEDLDDEKKPELAGLAGNTLQDEVAAYMAEMEREREAAAMRAKEEDDEEEDEDLEFEDVVDLGGGGNSNVGTPSSSLPQPVEAKPAVVNGIKRDLDEDGVPSSEANTPASFVGHRDTKRVKLENGSATATNGDIKVEGNTSSAGLDNGGAGAVADGDQDSEEDEDFEDAM
ncbi:Transcription factor efuD [Exophiala dermatitidis]